MSRKILMFAVAVLGLGAVTAQAHPKLQQSFPAQGAKLNAAPKEIRLNFSEGLIASFTGLELKDSKGRTVPTARAALVSGDSKTMVAPITGRLAAGNYTVNWHAVSMDTHRVSGSYGFKVVK